MTSNKEKEVLLKLIDVYKDMPYLWQKNHTNYNNKDVREEGLKVLLEVYKEFDARATLSLLKKKLLNMQSNYNKELNKVKASKHTGAGLADVYVPTLWYYDAFSFLESTSEPCRPVRDSFENENESQDMMSMMSDKDSSQPSENAASTSSGHSKKRKETLLQKQEIFFKTTEKLLLKQEEEWEVFGKSIGLQMKDLNKKQMIICQKIISDAIFLAKLNRLSEDSYIVTPHPSTSEHQQQHQPTINRHNPQNSSATLIYEQSSDRSVSPHSPTVVFLPQRKRPSLSPQHTGQSSYYPLKLTHQALQSPNHPSPPTQCALQSLNQPLPPTQYALQSPNQPSPPTQYTIQSPTQPLPPTQYALQSPSPPPQHTVQSPMHQSEIFIDAIESSQQPSSSQSITIELPELPQQCTIETSQPQIVKGPANVLNQYLILKPRKK
ncbi:hypothetical protein ACJJTC_014432 [Scirpophaga incertulas]